MNRRRSQWVLYRHHSRSLLLVGSGSSSGSGSGSGGEKTKLRGDSCGGRHIAQWFTPEPSVSGEAVLDQISGMQSMVW